MGRPSSIHASRWERKPPWIVVLYCMPYKAAKVIRV